MDWDTIKRSLGFDSLAALLDPYPVKVADLDSYKQRDWRALVRDLGQVEGLAPGLRQHGYDMAFAWGASEIHEELLLLEYQTIELDGFVPRPLADKVRRFLEVDWVGRTSNLFGTHNALGVINAWILADLGKWEQALQRLRALPAEVAEEHLQAMERRMWEDYVSRLERGPERRALRRAILTRCAPLKDDLRAWLVRIHGRYGALVAAHAARDLGDDFMATQFAGEVARKHGVYRLHRAVLDLKSVNIAFDEVLVVVVFERLMHHRLYLDATALAFAFRMEEKIAEVARVWNEWAVETGNIGTVPDREGGWKTVPRGDGSSIRCAPDPRYRDESGAITA